MSLLLSSLRVPSTVTPLLYLPQRHPSQPSGRRVRDAMILFLLAGVPPPFPSQLPSSDGEISPSVEFRLRMRLSTEQVRDLGVGRTRRRATKSGYLGTITKLIPASDILTRISIYMGSNRHIVRHTAHMLYSRNTDIYHQGYFPRSLSLGQIRHPIHMC